MRVERRTRIGLRVIALLYLAALLAIPVGLVFYRTFEHGLGAVYDSVTTPAAIHAFWLTIEIAAIAVPLPAIRWGIAYGVVLSTARAIGEFGAVSVVSGKISGQTETLTLLVEKRFQNFDVAGAYAASALLAVIALATLLAMTVIKPRKEP